MWESIAFNFAADQALKKATERGFIDNLVAFFRKKRKILVLGATGVGKTLMMRSLKDEIVRFIPGHDRTRITEVNKIIFGNLPSLFYDTPGHIDYRTEQREVTKMALRQGVTLILNVVSYGYHETFKSSLEAIDTSGNPRKDYLEQSRQAEIELLSDWAGLVDREFTKRVITVISKADLWCLEKYKVNEYYSHGPYFRALGNFPNSIPHVVLPYCSAIEPFYGVSMSKIGETEKSSIQAFFLSELLSAMGRVK